MDLAKDYYKTGRNITCDNFFTSFDLGRQLLKEKLTIVGTIRKNRTELPPSFANHKGRLPLTTKYGFQHDAMIVSYYPKKGKVVPFLSTMHNERGEENPINGKPEVIAFYNSTKGGVDTADQMLRGYSVKRMTRRWPMVIFYNMVDVSVLNATILYLSLNQNSRPKRKNVRRSIIIDLAMSLIKVSPESASDQNVVQSVNLQKDKWLDSQPRGKKRCFLCTRGHDRKSRTLCCECYGHVCGQHQVTLCLECHPGARNNAE